MSSLPSVPVNLWALGRSTELRAILINLQNQLGTDSFIVDSNAATDTDAIYLIHPMDPAVKAYLFLHGQNSDRCGVHLEYPDSMPVSSLYDAHEQVDLPTLAQMLAVHFDIASVQDLP